MHVDTIAMVVETTQKAMMVHFETKQQV